jgi:effector-binding domain-containing protein
MGEYEVIAKEIDPVRVAILRDTIESYAKVGRLFKELHQTLAEAGIAPSGPQLAVYFDEEYTPRNADVAAAVPVAEEAHLPAGGRVQIGELPGGLMVSVMRDGPWDDFRPAYEAIMDWVLEHGYAITGPNREIHWQGPRSGVPPEAYQLEIQFPIRKL